MFRISNITHDWEEAGSFAAQLNLYGFWDENSFLTKTGDLGAVLKVEGIDYESLDHAGRDYAVKRLEALSAPSMTGRDFTKSCSDTTIRILLMRTMKIRSSAQP